MTQNLVTVSVVVNDVFIKLTHTTATVTWSSLLAVCTNFKCCIQLQLYTNAECKWAIHFPIVNWFLCQNMKLLLKCLVRILTTSEMKWLDLWCGLLDLSFSKKDSDSLWPVLTWNTRKPDVVLNRNSPKLHHYKHQELLQGNSCGKWAGEGQLMNRTTFSFGTCTPDQGPKTLKQSKASMQHSMTLS